MAECADRTVLLGAAVGFTGELDDIVADDLSSSPSIVTIEPTDAGFSAGCDCCTWTKVG